MQNKDLIRKYTIRVIGALCILGALAMMFLPGWVELDGIRNRYLRYVRSDASGICSYTKETFLSRIEWDENFEYELEDYDLPYTRSSIKARFKEIKNLANDLLDNTISLKDLLSLLVKAPGLLSDTENILDSDILSAAFFDSAANYVVHEGSLSEYRYDDYATQYLADSYRDGANEIVTMFSDYSFVFILLTCLLILIFVLGVTSAITHVCNKGRWLKYLFLAIVVILVAGSCVAFSLVSDMLAEFLTGYTEFEDITLKVTTTPFIAVVLTIVPIVLDIVFKNRKKITNVEEVTDGK